MATIEEKAKAYDEAIKVIKDNLDALNEIAETGAEVVNIQSIKNCFYRAFPELRESEDEKVRNEIKDVFYSLGEGKIPVSINFAAIFDWLEKQSKIVAYYEDRLDECACKYFDKGYKHALENQSNPTDINPSELSWTYSKRSCY